MTTDDPTKDANHEATIDLMRAELAARNLTIAELSANLSTAKGKLAYYEGIDTEPPPAPKAEPITADYTEDARIARLSLLETAASTREQELTEVHTQLKDIKKILTDLALDVASLPCNKCPLTPRLSSVPIAKGE